MLQSRSISGRPLSGRVIDGRALGMRGSGTGSGPTFPTNAELREDGSYELREDGSYELREDAPVLSSPIGTKTGSSTADLSVSTNQGNGTLYGVVTTGATPPTRAQVKAGQGSDGSAATVAFNQPVVSAGVQTKSVTGLSGGATYYAHFMHEETTTDQSNVASSSSFTTDSIANAETTTWVNAVVGDGGSVSAGRQTTVDTLISSLKSAGVWTKLDRLWLFAAENSQSALRDIVAAAAATATSSPTFAANQGYTGNGSSSYIDSNVTPGSGQYTQNSNHLGGYVLTSRTTSNAYAIAGTKFTNASATFDFLISRFSDATAYYSSSAGATNASALNANAQGQYIGTRTSSAQIDMYRNGNTTAIATNNASTSASLANQTVVFLARRAAAGVGATVTDFSTDQLAAGYFGSGLSSAQMSSLASAVNAYMTSLSINVY